MLPKVVDGADVKDDKPSLYQEPVPVESVRAPSDRTVKTRTFSPPSVQTTDRSERHQIRKPTLKVRVCRGSVMAV